MRHQIALACALISCVCATACKAGAAPNDHPSVLGEINGAIQVADLERLGAFYASDDPVVHVLGAMAIERVHRNLEQSSRDAQLCEEALREKEPLIAHYCARFSAANLRLQGQWQHAAKVEQFIAQRYRGAISGDQIQNPDLAQSSLYAYLPEIAASIPSGVSTVPFVAKAKHSSNVNALINGKGVLLELDTGAPTILGERTAKQLGVRILLESDGMFRGLLGKGEVKKLGFIDSFSLGDITIRNIPVAVVSGERNLLGIDVLTQLGAFEITENALSVFGKEVHAPQCEEPLLTGTAFWGGHPRLFAQVVVDGAPSRVVLDTGSSFYLTSFVKKTQGPLERESQLRISDLNHGGQPVRIAEVTSDIEMAGTNYRVTHAAMEMDAQPFKYLLGEGALRDVSIMIDFNHRTACLLSQGAPSRSPERPWSNPEHPPVQ